MGIDHLSLCFQTVHRRKGAKGLHDPGEGWPWRLYVAPLLHSLQMWTVRYFRSRFLLPDVDSGIFLILSDQGYIRMIG